MTASKDWTRRHADPLATKQRWYCWCDAKYKATWGQVIEMRTTGGKLLYAKTECPPAHVLDVRAMHVEQTIAMNVRSATELFDLIPKHLPTASGGILVPNEEAKQWGHDNRFRVIDLATLDAMPFYNCLLYTSDAADE